MTRAKDISKIVTDANFGGTLDVTGDLTVDTNTLYVDSANNRVGVGTVSPSFGFEYVNSSPILQIKDSNSTGNAANPYVRMVDSADTFMGAVGFASAATGEFYVLNASANPISFYTNNTEAMRIDSSGNVGIGTSSPTASLEISGTDDANNLIVGHNNTDFAIYTDSTIGEIRLKAEDGSGSNFAKFMSFYTQPSGSAAEEQMRITSAGKVGINTTDPTGKLEINGSDNALFAMRTTGDTASQVMGTQYLNNSGAVTAQTFATGDSSSSSVFRIKAIGSIDLIGGDIGVTGAGPDLRIASDGNVGIGVSSPQELLHIKDGNIAVGNGTASNNAIIGRIGFSTDSSNSRFIGIESFRGGDAANADLRFHTFGGDGNNGERMRIDTAGNVGIGTSSPSTARLQVREDTNASDTLQVSSQLQFAGQYHDLAIGIDDFYAVGMRRQLTTSTPAYLNPRLDFFVQNHNTYLKGDRGVKMTILNDGNVGIGTSSPSSYNSSLNNLVIADAGDSGLTIVSGTSSEGSIAFADGTSGADAYRGWINYSHASNYMRMFTNGSERMRILSDGSNRTRVYIDADDPAQNSYFTVTGNNNAHVMITTSDTSTSGGAAVRFKVNAATVGQITCSASSTSYGTTSDYRLKENVTADWDATTRLKQLNPVRFNFIADADTTVDGFLAHEVQSVVPEAITGTHNEVEVWKDGEELPNGVSVGDNKLDDDGNTIPKYQGIDQSKIVPLLVKTIQELEARIVALETA